MKHTTTPRPSAAPPWFVAALLAGAAAIAALPAITPASPRPIASETAR
ncbi:MAG: hypothetical protein JWP92_2359 [Caulobacter sp.]|nr:hypothetical protein [Caulobacter sp.]